MFKEQKNYEPIILEKEKFKSVEWALLRKLFIAGKKADMIVLDVKSVEYFRSSKK